MPHSEDLICLWLMGYMLHYKSTSFSTDICKQDQTYLVALSQLWLPLKTNGITLKNVISLIPSVCGLCALAPGKELPSQLSP